MDNNYIGNSSKIDISVIIPAYNVEKYIRRAIESVINQNSVNLEVIVIDDGSTDNTESCINNIQDARIRVISQTNKGAYFARLTGVKIARGRYITFVDGDDYIDENIYAPFLKKMDSENLSVLEYGYRRVTDNQILETFKFTSQYRDKVQSAECIISKTNSSCSLCNKIIKKELFNQLFNEKINKHEEDLFMNLKLLTQCEKYYVDSTVGYNYYYHTDSTSNSNVDTKEWLNTWKYIYELTINDFIQLRQLCAATYCARIAYCYCAYQSSRELRDLFFTIYRENNLHNYKIKHESVYRKAMISLFKICPPFCRKVFQVFKKIHT